MRFWFSLTLSLLMAQAAFAHVGHFGDLAGHDHWIAAGALGAAIALAGLAALKGRKKEPQAEPTEEAATDQTPQEA